MLGAECEPDLLSTRADDLETGTFGTTLSS